MMETWICASVLEVVVVVVVPHETELVCWVLEEELVEVELEVVGVDWVEDVEWLVVVEEAEDVDEVDVDVD